MESNGAKNHIYISQTTADLPKTFGKSDWVLIGSDKVVAKCKGELQTYSLNAQSSKSVTPTSTTSYSQLAVVKSRRFCKYIRIVFACALHTLRPAMERSKILFGSKVSRLDLLPSQTSHDGTVEQ
eukprot:scaffold1048_cov90-Amphora_coffeaeformis.AAC.8